MFFFIDFIKFECVKLQNNLTLKSNTLSGVDIKDWKMNSVLKDSNQTISGSWNVKGDIAFKSIDGDGYLNNFNVFKLDEDLEMWKSGQIKLQYDIKVSILFFLFFYCYYFFFIFFFVINYLL